MVNKRASRNSTHRRHGSRSQRTWVEESKQELTGGCYTLLVALDFSAERRVVLPADAARGQAAK